MKNCDEKSQPAGCSDKDRTDKCTLITEHGTNKCT